MFLIQTVVITQLQLHFYTIFFYDTCHKFTTATTKGGNIATTWVNTTTGSITMSCGSNENLLITRIRRKPMVLKVVDIWSVNI